MMFDVMRGDFVHQVAARGELESSVNVEVKCEVRARTNAWTRILEVVPEGTAVQPGDFLVRLDSSALEDDRTQQEIYVEQAEARVIQTRSRLPDRPVGPARVSQRRACAAASGGRDGPSGGRR